MASLIASHCRAASPTVIFDSSGRTVPLASCRRISTRRALASASVSKVSLVTPFLRSESLGLIWYRPEGSFLMVGISTATTLRRHRQAMSTDRPRLGEHVEVLRVQPPTARGLAQRRLDLHQPESSPWWPVGPRVPRVELGLAEVVEDPA